MRPPICDVCGFDESWWLPLPGGVAVPPATTVICADFEALAPGCVGHPRGMLWVCAEHREALEARARLPGAEAIASCRRDLGILPASPPALWLTAPGPNRHRVVSLVRRFLGVPPAEALGVVRAVPVVLCRVPWPPEAGELVRALVEAGARVEVRPV